VIRSRSSDVVKSTQLRDNPYQSKTIDRRDDRTEIELLAQEHRYLVFWLLREARQGCMSVTKRLSWLLLTNTLLIISLVIVSAILHTGIRIANPIIHFLLLLSEIITMLLLVGSSVLTIFGIAFSNAPGPTITIPGEKIPRQQTLTSAQANLTSLRLAERKASLTLRWSVFLLLPGLLVYGFILILLVL
jgi:hypothetical protein